MPGNPDKLMPKLCELNPAAAKIIVVGDLHGTLKTLKAAVAYWQTLTSAPLVLLGDYADRGGQGVETIEAVIELSYSKNVITLKGNHEDYSAGGEPLFQPWSLVDEVESKRGAWPSYFNQTLKPFFDRLCLAALLPGKVLFVHGGVSSRLVKLENLSEPLPELEKDILWSDPVESRGERPNPRGSGVEFGSDITRRVLKNLGVKYLLRSHQPNLAHSGPCYSQGGRVVTLSATDCYGGRPFFLELENESAGLKFITHFV